MLDTSTSRSPIAALAFALLAAGCGDDASEVASGRGSVACQDWQDAICDFGADECGLTDRARCDSQYQGVVCRDDAQASACANDLNAASCLAPPQGCDIRDLADPAPAQAACTTLLSAICERNARCSGSTIDTERCIAAQEIVLSFDCAQALSIDLRYEHCLELLQDPACGDVPADACTNVVRVAR